MQAFDVVDETDFLRVLISLHFLQVFQFLRRLLGNLNFEILAELFPYSSVRSILFEIGKEYFNVVCESLLTPLTGRFRQFKFVNKSGQLLNQIE